MPQTPQKSAPPSSRTIWSIIKENVFTLFNVMLALVALMVLSTGSYADCLFIIVIVINAAIGIVTELRAKRELDKLSILVSAHYPTLRLQNGQEQQLTLLGSELIVGDIITLKTGDQIPADGEFIGGSVEVDESMLTGESRAQKKDNEGDEMFSGTTVVSGSAQMKVLVPAEDSKAARLTKQGKVFKLASSDLRDGINSILKYISFGIVPVAALLIWSQMSLGHAWQQSVLQAASGIVGMIPEGLVLLTSMNFAISAMLLAKKRVLVTELNSVETLARVNELLLDKTGTITDGTVEVQEIVTLADFGDHGETAPALPELLAVSKLPGGTATSDAVIRHLEAQNVVAAEVKSETPFSSARKYSAVETSGGVYKLGAPEFIVRDYETSLAPKIAEYQNQGLRVLAFTHNDNLNCLLIAREHIRESAAATIQYFRNSGVNVRIISGDNPETVKQIASVVGVDPQFVTGRALPETKLELVNELQAEGKVVAMTGDGVNDMLALKQADLGIAMGNAAPSSKAVANLVLLDGDFGMLPAVIAQGRRVIANIERVASLFLVKTFYSIALTLSTIALASNYPFLPRHLTLISALTIGIPAFFLALPPNNELYRPGFLKRVLKFSAPLGILAAVAIQLVCSLFPQYSPGIQVAAMLAIAFLVVALKSRPLKSWRGIMLLLLISAAAACFVIPLFSQFFWLDLGTLI